MTVKLRLSNDRWPFCSHFLYPVRQTEQTQEESEGGDASSSCRDGKYELFSQVDEVVKREMKQLVMKGKCALLYIACVFAMMTLYCSCQYSFGKLMYFNHASFKWWILLIVIFLLCVFIWTFHLFVLLNHLLLFLLLFVQQVFFSSSSTSFSFHPSFSSSFSLPSFHILG